MQPAVSVLCAFWGKFWLQAEIILGEIIFFKYMFVYLGGEITCIWVLKHSASYFLQKAVNTSNEYKIATAALFIIYTVRSSLFPDGTLSVVGILILIFLY